MLGTAASLGIASMSRKSRLLVTNITYIPVVNPEIITGISLMLLFVAYQRFATQSAWLPDNIMGLPTLLIAHIAFNVPYVIFNVSPKLKQLDIKLTRPGEGSGAVWLAAAAAKLLAQVPTHEAWACRERIAIDRHIADGKRRVRELTEQLSGLPRSRRRV